MRQLTTLSLFLIFLLNISSSSLFSKTNDTHFFEKESSAEFSSLLLVLSPTDPSCAMCTDGKVFATVAGGIAPYNYQWSTGASTDTIMGLSSSTYTVTVSDVLGASLVDSVTLVFTPNETLTLQAFTLSPSCHSGSNGSAVAVASGGTAPYVYTWNPGNITSNSISNLASGSYSVFVTDSVGAQVEIGVEITQPDTLTVGVTTIPGCEGPTSGSAFATGSGGVLPYSYAWSTGDSTQQISNLSTATIGVTITDANGCVANAQDFLIQTIEVNVNPIPVAPSCFDTSDGYISASAWGGTEPYTFAWSNGQTVQTIDGLDPGSYFVTVTDALGCSVVGDVFLDAGNPLDIAVEGITTVTCAGGSDGGALINAFGGSGTGYSYLWDNGDASGFSQNMGSGMHYVTITDSNNCTHVDSVFISEPLPLASFTFASPVCNEGMNGTVEVVPSGGTLPYTYAWSTGDVTQVVDGLPLGMYLVTITDINGCSKTDSIEVTLNSSAFTGTTATTEVSCTDGNDGTAAAIPTGGVAPYTYLWSTGSTDSMIVGLTSGTYTVTVFDAFNCTLIETATVAPPTPFVANQTIVNAGCGASGSISIDPIGGTPPYTVSWSTGSGEFQIINLDAGTYTVNILDVNQCFMQFSFDVSAENNTPPTIITQEITVALNPNNVATITAEQIDNGTFDDCDMENISIDITQFDCSNIGENTVTFTAMDNSGNTATSTAIVNVVDETLPMVVTQDITVELNADGVASISTMDINNGSEDNCGITNMSLDITEFDCSNLGMNTVILTASDQSGNIQTGTAMVTVVDDQDPVVTTNPFTIYLDAQGMATLQPSDIAMITDNCSVDSFVLGITQFSCSDVGMNLVSLTATDAAGNSATGSALVTVADTLAPQISCIEIVSKFSCDDAGVVVNFDVPTVTDNCDANAAVTLESGMASGSTFPLGTTTNTYTYTSPTGETVTCSFDVIVLSGIIEIQLDSVVTPTVGSSDGSISITVTGANPLTYEWTLGGAIVSNEEDPSGLSTGGIYELTVTDANGCTETFTVDFMTAINDHEVVKNVRVYPNPTSEMLYVNIDLAIQKDTKVQLFNLDGKLLLENKTTNLQDQVEMNVANFASGVYILKIAVNDDIVTKRIAISR